MGRKILNAKLESALMKLSNAQNSATNWFAKQLAYPVAKVMTTGLLLKSKRIGMAAKTLGYVAAMVFGTCQVEASNVHDLSRESIDMNWYKNEVAKLRIEIMRLRAAANAQPQGQLGASKSDVLTKQLKKEWIQGFS